MNKGERKRRRIRERRLRRDRILSTSKLLKINLNKMKTSGAAMPKEEIDDL